MTPRLLLFDLDGTLVDSRRDLARSANELLESRGARPLPAEQIVRMVGDGARRLVERAFDAAGLGEVTGEHVAEFVRIYERHLVDTTVPYEGVGELLGALAPHAILCVITNKPQRPTDRLLEWFDLHRHFRHVIGGDGRFPRKPAPDALLAMVAACGAVPGQAVMIGDSQVDVRAARAAGVPFCLARYGFGAEQLPPGLVGGGDWVIDRPLDLLALAAGVATTAT